MRRFVEYTDTDRAWTPEYTNITDAQDVATFLITERVPLSLTVMPEWMWKETLNDDELIWVLTQWLFGARVAFIEAQQEVVKWKKTTKYRMKHDNFIPPKYNARHIEDGVEILNWQGDVIRSYRFDKDGRPK